MTEAATQTPSPYKGLTHYSEEDSAYFFGRESERQIISANLIGSRLTIVYGESGVGKSSLLRAGVARYLSRLAHENLAELDTPEFVPVVFSQWRDDPVPTLGRAIAAAAAEYSEEGGDDEAVDGRLDEILARYSERLNATFLIVLDQFEEYFLYHPQDEGEDSFAAQFARAVNRRDLRANFIVSIREDALAALDRFQGRIPQLFDNYVRIEHLDRDSARAAIVKPIEQLNSMQSNGGEPYRIEPELVDAVLDQVRTGEVLLAGVGEGQVDGGGPPAPDEERIQTPYLQLVMSRLWLEEAAAGSRVLRLETLERLGGAERIVRTHLDQAMETLPEGERDTAAAIFRHLVTPSGTKIAHTVPDLAEYAGKGPDELEHVLEELSSGDVRILRPVAPPPGHRDGSRYEIFHDVLAAPILDWRARYVEAKNRAEAERELAATREQAHRERRRARIFRTIAVVAAAAAVAATVLGVIAWQQKKTERANTLAAQAIGALAVNPAQSVQLAARAVHEKKTSSAEDALRRSLSESQARLTLVGDTDSVDSAAFSPNGKYIVTASEDHTARIWNAATGDQVRKLVGHTDFVNDAVFSPNGRYVATACSDNSVRLWNVATGKSQVLRGHTASVNSLSFSRDGRRLASASDDGTVRIWRVRGGRAAFVRAISAEPLGLLSVAFSPDGKSLATSGYTTTIKIWNASTGKLKTKYNYSADWVYSVAFSPDGTYLVSASADGTAHVSNVRNGDCCWLLAGHTDEVTDAVFSPDGNLVVTTSEDGTARVWEWRLEKELYELRGHTDAVYGAAFSPDGRRIATASADRTVRVWDAGSGETLRGDTYKVFSAHYSPDGRRVVTASADLTARIWDARTGRLLRTLQGQDWIRDAEYSPDGRYIVTTGNDQLVRIWDARTGKQVRDWGGHTFDIYTARFSRDGKRIVTASGDQTARIWTSRGKTLHLLVGHGDFVYSASFSPDGKYVATGGDDETARIWNASTGKQIRVLRGHRGAVFDVEFSPDGTRVVTASGDNTARVWGVNDGKALLTLTGHTGPVRTASYSPDGRMIVTASADATTRVWDAHSGRLLALLRRHADSVRTAVFSPDGKHILTAGDDWTARIYGCTTCGAIGPLEQRARDEEKLLRLDSVPVRG